MTSPAKIIDRPFLRLYDPETLSSPQSAWTLQKAFDDLRWPDCQKLKSASDGRRWMRFWQEFEAELCAAQRIVHPLSCADIGSRELKAFQLWMQEAGRFPPPKGASSINKAIREIILVLSLASQEGIEVQTVKQPKQLRTQARPRFYFDDSAVERLWDAASHVAWPPARVTSPRAGTTYRGSGVAPVVFWRSLLVLLRNYGMRVQDLVAYARHKSPLKWKDITFDPQSPNPESLESWPLGWLYYRASKTEESSGREYYLPMTPSARAAIDRMRAGAFAANGGTVPPDALVFNCPRSHGLTRQFKDLQSQGKVATRAGVPYVMEDFRKTVATYSSLIHDDLPHALCGWGGGGIKHKHYQQPEPLLVRKLSLCPLPECFGEWVDPNHVASVDAFLRSI
ncbi:site-specific integrase [Aureliella helgolandensis]|uniref:Core-binding (CB) domain-containing protein n=1 Tax=Aureliella helgolandensis TaxID=2527968 RepID=A0A518GE74_9BACT|nr:hypothetical protein [Aureliella helgolandensis]QDV26904.1 hypothetical protein Q31a_52840 [Aureliella helgolandensis]